MKYDDIRTSIDCRYLAHRDRDGMAWVEKFRRSKRTRRHRFVAWLKGLRLEALSTPERADRLQMGQS